MEKEELSEDLLNDLTPEMLARIEKALVLVVVNKGNDKVLVGKETLSSNWTSSCVPYQDWLHAIFHSQTIILGIDTHKQLLTLSAHAPEGI